MKQMFIIGLMLILFAGLTLAVPGVPHVFEGSVTVNGAPAPDGTTVTATVDGVTRGEGSTFSGTYGQHEPFQVLDPDNVYGTYHPEIQFYVDGYYTGEAVMFIAGNTTLDLSVSYSTGGSTGGDTGGSSGGGGGGGGGGLGAVDLWDCEEWSECVDGEQTQDCTQGSSVKTNTRECDLEDLVPGTTSLIPPIPPGFEEENAGEDAELLESPGAPPITGLAALEEEESDKSFAGMITGNWMVPFLLGVVVVLLVLVLIMGRGRKKTPKSFESKSSESPGLSKSSESLKPDSPPPSTPEPEQPEPEQPKTVESKPVESKPVESESYSSESGMPPTSSSDKTHAE